MLRVQIPLGVPMRTTHRTLLKIILNPILRKLGWSIVSVFIDDTFVRYELRSYPQYCKVIKEVPVEGKETNEYTYRNQSKRKTHQTV